MKVYIETHGCTANISDSQDIRNAIMASGGVMAEKPEDADIVIINTCAVTEFTSRSMLKAIRGHKNKRVIVAGCMAAAQPYLVEPMGGNIECVNASGPLPVVRALGIKPAEGKPFINGVTATISIAEGCLGRCSYCIVRLVRGPLCSVPPARVIGQIKNALDSGAREIFLTAQDTGAYGRDMGTRLPELMHGILAMDGNYKIRLGMMNPFSIAGIADDMVEVFNDPRVYRFAHIPIQSGSDRILKLMNRPYSAGEYGAIIKRLRDGVPDITISTDYIVGFPTESEEDFALTMEELKSDRPLKVNITRFSPRPGTPAASMEGLPFRIKKERSRKLTQLHHDITSAYMRDSIGRRLNVMVTEPGKPGSVVARDDYYHMVVIPGDHPPGARMTVRICGASTTYIIGEPIDK
jgi:MiaB-like tRNA modifying enzyme